MIRVLCMQCSHCRSGVPFELSIGDLVRREEQSNSPNVLYCYWFFCFSFKFMLKIIILTLLGSEGFGCAVSEYWTPIWRSWVRIRLLALEIFSLYYFFTTFCYGTVLSVSRKKSVRRSAVHWEKALGARSWTRLKLKKEL